MQTVFFQLFFTFLLYSLTGLEGICIYLYLYFSQIRMKVSREKMSFNIEKVLNGGRSELSGS